MGKIYVAKLSGLKTVEDLDVLQKLTEEDRLLLFCKKGETIQAELLPVIVSMKTQPIIYYTEEDNIVKEMLLLGQLSCNADVVAVGIGKSEHVTEYNMQNDTVFSQMLHTFHTIVFCKTFKEALLPATGRKNSASETRRKKQQKKEQSIPTEPRATKQSSDESKPLPKFVTASKELSKKPFTGMNVPQQNGSEINKKDEKKDVAKDNNMSVANTDKNTSSTPQVLSNSNMDKKAETGGGMERFTTLIANIPCSTNLSYYAKAIAKLLQDTDNIKSFEEELLIGISGKTGRTILEAILPHYQELNNCF